MLDYVLEACREVGVQRIFVVVGYCNEQVRERYKADTAITWVEQKEQLGTAHAVMCCKEYLKDFDGQTLVLCGDGPLIRSHTLQTLVTQHESGRSATTLATALLDNPHGYGRIVRDSYGNIQGIVEESDCTPEQKAIREVNPSYYLFNNKLLFETLEKIKPDNVKGEYYVTDALALIIASGHRVTAITAVRPEEAMGVNSRAQLSVASKIMQERIQQKLMEDGVTIVDPDNTWIDARARIGQDTVVEPFTYIHGEVKIGKNCRIGPFAYVRHGTEIGDDVVLGVFTELKNTNLAEGARVRHHSYLGDATVGRNANIGAGSLTANFDGHEVQQTVVGDDCFIGTGAVLIAPLKIGDKAHIASGTVVSQDSVNELGAGTQ